MRMSKADYDCIQNNALLAGMTMTDFLTLSALVKEIIISKSFGTRQDHFVCSTSKNKGKEACSTHFIRAIVLEDWRSGICNMLPAL